MAKMNYIQCACVFRCHTPDVIIPWATLMPPVIRCEKIKYCTRGVDIWYVSGKFMIGVTSDRMLYIDASIVDIMLFYYSMLIRYQFTICTDGCGVDWHNNDTTVIVSNNSIQFQGQRVKPLCAFTVSGHNAVLDIGDKVSLVKFIAISLATNGDHLIY